MSTFTIGDLTYEGIFDRHHGLQYKIRIIKDGPIIKHVIVVPSLDDVFIPEEIRPEISNFVRGWFNYKKEPIYFNPRLN